MVAFDYGRSESRRIRKISDKMNLVEPTVSVNFKIGVKFIGILRCNMNFLFVDLDL